MYIIVGLGNPTRQYEGTKHNVGFDTIDYLIDEYQIPSSGTGHKALFGKGMIAGQKVIVAKPMTYGTGGEYADPVQPGFNHRDGFRRVPVECGRAS